MSTAALRLGAHALGAELIIETTSAYHEYTPDPRMVELVEEIGSSMFGGGAVKRTAHHSGGSTDMGDLSAVMPVVQVGLATGVTGGYHGPTSYAFTRAPLSWLRIS